VLNILLGFVCTLGSMFAAYTMSFFVCAIFPIKLKNILSCWLHDCHMLPQMKQEI